MLVNSFELVNTWDTGGSTYTTIGNIPVALTMTVAIQEAANPDQYDIIGNITMPSLSMGITVQEAVGTYDYDLIGSIPMPTLSMGISVRESDAVITLPPALRYLILLLLATTKS